MLAAQQVSKSFKNKVVFDRLSFTAKRGQVVAVVGENGCGKSTLLKMLAGLMAPDSGQIYARGSVGYCPQDPGVFGRLTIDEHLKAFGSGFGLDEADAIRVGRSYLDALGMPPGEDGRAMNLSGGTRQKLNLALALLGDPDMLLLDEPYQGFDHGTYVNFWELVRGWADEGRGVIVITHMLAELDLADRVVDLGRHARTRQSVPS
jgi:ABC-2 type transport system ATP-binding protein